MAHRVGFHLVGAASDQKAEPHDWKSGAPRWFLVSVIGVLLVACGGLAGFAFGRSTERDREQARLAERVSVLEVQWTMLPELIAKMEKLSDVTAKLTTKMEVFAAKFPDNPRPRQR